MHENKEHLLKDAGYIEHFDRNAYFNRAAKKVFSTEIVDDKSAEWLTKALTEPNESETWVFYADPIPSEKAIQAFLASIS